MRFEEPKEKDYPGAVPNPVGIDGVLEGYCPPYRDPAQAVLEIADIKWGQGGIYSKRGYDLPVPEFYKDIVDATRAFCSYLYGRYGRMPKQGNALFIPILAQVHHLDSGFYEKYFPEYLEESDRNHMAEWHPAGEQRGHK
jgi:hypothetical protein